MELANTNDSSSSCRMKQLHGGKSAKLLTPAGFDQKYQRICWQRVFGRIRLDTVE